MSWMSGRQYNLGCRSRQGRGIIRSTHMRRILPALVLLSILLPRVAPAQERVATPVVKAMPATATSRPFLDSAHVFVPIDLAKAGYVEEEYFVSGTANVYDWATDGAVTVRTAG